MDRKSMIWIQFYAKLPGWSQLSNPSDLPCSYWSRPQSLAQAITQARALRQRANSSPFYWYGLTLIPAWISKHMPRKVWNEITYPFPNFNGGSVEVWEWISNFIPHIIMDVITYPCWDLSQSMLVIGWDWSFRVKLPGPRFNDRSSFHIEKRRS